MLVQHAHVELHHVPAYDGVGIMFGHPLVQLEQQVATGGAEFKVEIDRCVGLKGFAQHVHLTLATALQGNGVQVAVSTGFDVQ